MNFATAERAEANDKGGENAVFVLNYNKTVLNV